MRILYFFSLFLMSMMPLFAHHPFSGMYDNIYLYEKRDEKEEGFLRYIKLNAIIQYQMAVVQPNGSNGQNFKNGASPFNDEMRRVWASINAGFSTGTTFSLWWKFGGMPSMDTYVNGRTQENYTYGGLFSVQLAQKLPVEGLTLRAGKLKVLFLDEYLPSNVAIPTIERSILYNQYSHEANWGMEMHYEPHAGTCLYLQLLGNDRASGARSMTHSDRYESGYGLKGEFGYEDKIFAVLGGSWREGEERYYHQYSFQYTHDFNNVYDGRRSGGANNYGLGVKDAISLGYHLSEGDFQLSLTALANFELQNADETRGSENNLGFSVMPRYLIDPNVELVMRYAVSMGQGAVSLYGERYIARQTTADLLVDSAHTFYMGVNYYMDASDPNMAKIMLGAEYITARKDSKTAYNGWTYSAALRFYF